MTAPLDGIRVLEVANWLAAPAAAALLADLGADVVKVEPPEGDVFRSFVLSSMGYTHEFAGQLRLRARQPRQALDDGGARPAGRPRAGATARRDARRVPHQPDAAAARALRADLRGRARRESALVYASFSGYGARGPDRARPGFDYAAFWARSGLMSLLGEPPSPPPLCRGGQGDHTTALNILAAVLAALRLRDQTGEGQHVEVTLQGTGMWTLASDVQAALIAREQPRATRPLAAREPDLELVPGERRPVGPARDAAAGSVTGRASAPPIGKPEWADDPRYARPVAGAASTRAS